MGDSLYRNVNVTLSTQQKRLRHLSSIVARNLKPSRSIETTSVVDLETCFTLHNIENDIIKPAFYTSEVVKGSLNPSWRSFNLKDLKESTANTKTSELVIKVWQGVKSDHKVCMEWKVNLTGLVCVEDKVTKGTVHDVQYPSNTLLFTMFDQVYIVPQESEPPDPDRPPLDIDGAVAESYSTKTLARIQLIQRAIKQTQQRADRLRADIEESLTLTKNIQQKCSQREAMILRVHMLRHDAEARTKLLHTQKEEYERHQLGNHQRDQQTKSRYETLQRDKLRLHDKKKGYFDVRENLIRTGAELVMRRKQLMSELAFIFPVREVNQLPKQEFTIAGVKLPNSEEFQGHNESMIEASLGYTVQLVAMISTFLDVPMRYPMDLKGSRSQIRDHITDKLTDKERLFPLYLKGQDRFPFSYGVYLLNKNIAQLRYYCGLGTTDLRQTLSNLKSLLELRLGVKFETTHSALNAVYHQQSALPSTSRHTADGARSSLNGHKQLKNIPRGESSATGTATCDSQSKSSNSSTAEQDLFKGTPDSFFEIKSNSDANSAPKDTDSSSADIIELDDPSLVQEVDNISESSSKNSSSENHHAPMTTLNQLSGEQLLSSIANYDNFEATSSEESPGFASSFKMWPRASKKQSQKGTVGLLDEPISSQSPPEGVSFGRNNVQKDLLGEKSIKTLYQNSSARNTPERDDV